MVFIKLHPHPPKPTQRNSGSSSAVVVNLYQPYNAKEKEAQKEELLTLNWVTLRRGPF
jgi:hypothetical protein